MLHSADHKVPKGASQFSDKRQRIYDFLISNGIAVISSVGPNNDPHGAVIYFTINRDFTVAFITKSGTKKYDNLRHNNHVMLTVFEPHTQTTVQISGRASEMTDSSEINGIAQRILGTSLRTSDAGSPPLTKLNAGSYVAFEVEPVMVRMAVYARPDPGDYTELFETIESFGHNYDD
jgi:uncharacterized pyridoxamine 5'-phosphate oxidase family protein